MMYLNGQKGFIKDFFERTAKIIKSFEEINNDEYEVTLLCNCMVGILIFPEEKFYPDFKVKDTNLSINSKQILLDGLNGKYKPQSVMEILKRMRNAVSHCHMKFESATNYTSDNQIKYIWFYDDWKLYKDDKAPLEKYEFALKIDVVNLKEILLEICTNLFKKVEEL